MAFDGITVAALTKELQDKLTDGRINKISQPEPDELIFTIKTRQGSQKLYMSASASLPLVYLTEDNKPAPMTAPNFCMLLRKHIGSGRIVKIEQPGLERIIHFEIEHYNELGDLCSKILTVELMGKHSNIIFREGDMIIDSIKHISAYVSSVREVLPGREYFIPVMGEKANPLEISKNEFFEKVYLQNQPLSKALYMSLTGFSPVMAEELCSRASIESETYANTLGDIEKEHFYRQFENLIDDIKKGAFEPNIVYDDGEPVEFSAVGLVLYGNNEAKHFDSISTLLESYYAEKNTITRIRQKSADLRRIVQTALDRNYKKLQLQEKQLKDTDKRDKYRVYGELINAYGYGLEDGAASFEAFNYYTNENIVIPLDKDLSIRDNSVKYFDKYNKLKRTFEALSGLIEETKEEIEHLESVATSLEIALKEEDLVQIKSELVEFGYIKRHGAPQGKKEKVTSKPFHYVSSDGYHMYVGKNNYQNEELTFNVANGGDWWFHAKGIPGSHVIVKAEGDELPDRTFEEAAKLAAYYSKAKGAQKVEVDYTEKKNVKKASGGKPGFVIYHTNYSMIIEPDISGIEVCN